MNVPQVQDGTGFCKMGSRISLRSWVEQTLMAGGREVGCGKHGKSITHTEGVFQPVEPQRTAMPWLPQNLRNNSAQGSCLCVKMDTAPLLQSGGEDFRRHQVSRTLLSNTSGPR